MDAVLKCQIVVTNKQALRVLVAAVEDTEELLQDFPYRSEPKRICKALRYLLKNLELATE